MNYSSEKKPYNKRGQVTIFVIIGILLVAGVVLFFMLRDEGGEKEEGPSVSGEINPDSYMKTCVEDRVEKTIHILSRKGGYMNHSLNIRFLFKEEGRSWNITYLCYTEGENENCEIICPSVIGNLESEIKKEIEENVGNCFDNLVSAAKDKNYEISEREYNGFEANLIENELLIKTDSKLVLKKGDSTEEHKKIKMNFDTKLYSLGSVAQDIINSKSSSGTFDIVDYSMNNPEYKIETETRGITKIYAISYRETEEKFRFAVKGR